jgi:hypothetical protein
MSVQTGHEMSNNEAPYSITRRSEHLAHHVDGQDLQPIVLLRMFPQRWQEARWPEEENI